jgi:hypothetical protein
MLLWMVEKLMDMVDWWWLYFEGLSPAAATSSN